MNNTWLIYSSWTCPDTEERVYHITDITQDKSVAKNANKGQPETKAVLLDKVIRGEHPASMQFEMVLAQTVFPYQFRKWTNTKKDAVRITLKGTDEMHDLIEKIVKFCFADMMVSYKCLKMPEYRPSSNDTYSCVHEITFGRSKLTPRRKCSMEYIEDMAHRFIYISRTGYHYPIGTFDVKHLKNARQQLCKDAKELDWDERYKYGPLIQMIDRAIAAKEDKE